MEVKKAKRKMERSLAKNAKKKSKSFLLLHKKEELKQSDCWTPKNTDDRLLTDEKQP